MRRELVLSLLLRLVKQFMWMLPLRTRQRQDCSMSSPQVGLVPYLQRCIVVYRFLSLAFHVFAIFARRQGRRVSYLIVTRPEKGTDGAMKNLDRERGEQSKRSTLHQNSDPVITIYQYLTHLFNHAQQPSRGSNTLSPPMCTVSTT